VGTAEPTLLFHAPFDRSVLYATNVVDLGALVVRRDLDQLWFDPTLRRCVDWELLVRLSAQHTVTPLAVLAGTYVTSGGARITDPATSAYVTEFIARLRDPHDPLGEPRERPT
jgi:hypothetical protein